MTQLNYIYNEIYNIYSVSLIFYQTHIGYSTLDTLHWYNFGKISLNNFNGHNYSHLAISFLSQIHYYALTFEIFYN